MRAGVDLPAPLRTDIQCAMKCPYAEFVFEKWSFDRKSGEIALFYSFDGKVCFTERLFLNLHAVEWSKVDEAALERALDGLHLAGGVSYYKAYCPPRMRVKNQELSNSQAEFWNKFYTQGLGEFFFRNRISPAGRIRFASSINAHQPLEPLLDLAHRALVPIGGGKDSIVTAELLKRARIPFSLFSRNDYPAIRDTSSLIGAERIIVRRELSPLLFELNAQGALNGHVPITGYLSFLAVVSAILHGFRFIVMSLERSASFPQVELDGLSVNHQYSKSIEFEDDFRSYIEQHISSRLCFFSLLRPFYELKIAEMFCRISLEQGAPDYLGTFASCNSNFRERCEETPSRWCAACPKCAFVFSILAPFLTKERLVGVFGRDLFSETNLVETYRDLAGLTAQRPFECIGTMEETRLALYLSWRAGYYRDTPVMRMFAEQIYPLMGNAERLLQEVMQLHDAPNIPPDFVQALNGA